MDILQLPNSLLNAARTASPEARISQEIDVSSKAEAQAAGQFDSPELRKNIEDFANAMLDGTGTELAFKYNDQIQDWYAVIQNENTGEVVKQIPSKEVLALRANLKEMIGVFLDKKV